MSEVKVLRLSTGEDVIAKVDTGTEYHTLEKPFVIIPQQMGQELGVIDAIVAEPLGGAHRDQQTAIADLGDACFKQLQDLQAMGRDALVEDRAHKYLAMGEGAA